MMGGQDLGLGILISLRDAFSQNAGNVSGAMSDLDANVQAAAQNINRSMGMITTGGVMMGAGAALAAIPAALTASTIESQSALAGLSSMGVKDLQKVSDAASDFSNEWAGNTKAQILAGCYEIKGALANLSDEGVGGFAQAVALTATATKASFAEMTAAFTTGYGIFKPLDAEMSDIEWANKFSGAMAQTVAAFKTTGQEMADAIKNVGAMAAASKIPLEEQLAILGQLQTTMPGSEAGTLYKAFIQKVGVAGKELGLQLVGADGRVRGVIDVMNELKKKFPDLSQAAAQMALQKAFGTDEAVKFVLQMDQGFETLKTNIQGVSQAMEGGTATTEAMARAMTSDIGSQMALISQQARNLAETLGEVMLPTFLPFIKGVQTVVKGLQQWAKEHPGISRAVLGLTLGLGAALFVVGAFVAGLGAIGLMAAYVGPGLTALAGVFSGVWTYIVGTLLPVLPIIAMVALAGWLLYQAWNTNFGGIRDFVLGWYENIRLAFRGVSELVTSLANGTGKMSAETARALQNAGLLDFVITIFMVYYRVREFLSGLWQSFSSTFGQLRTIIEPPVRALVNAFGFLFRSIFGVFGIFRQSSSQVQQAANPYRQLGEVIGTVLGWVLKLATYLIAGLAYALTGVVYAVGGVIRAVTWVGEKLSWLWNTISGGVTGALTSARAEFDKWYATIMTVATILTTVFAPALINSVVNGVRGMIPSLVNGMGYLRSAGRAARALGEDFIYGFRRAAAARWSSITSGVQNMGNAIRTASVATYNYARAGWQLVASLARQGAAAVATGASFLWSKVVLIGQTIATYASAAASTIASVATWAFGAAVAFLTSPITLIILAVVALVAVGILLWKNWDKVKAWLVGCWESIKTAAVNVFNGVVGFFKKWGPTILAVISGPIGWIVLAVVKNWDKIKGALGAVWGWMKGVGSTIWDGVKGATSAVGGWISKGWDGIKNGASSAWNAIKNGASTYVSNVRGNFDMAKNVASGAWNSIVNGHGSMSDRLRAASGSMISAISARYPALGNAMSVVSNRISSTMSGAWSSIKGGASSAWSSIKGWASGAWSSIKTASSGAITSILSSFTSLIPNALESGKKLMHTLAEGISSAVMAPFNALKAGLGKLKNLLPHSDAKEGPLSDLTFSGFKVLDTMARGIEQASDIPKQAFADAFDFASKNFAGILPPALATPNAVPMLPERRARALADNRGARNTQGQAGAGSNNELGEPGVRDLLAALIREVGTLANRPIEATVISKIDGQTVAKGVYKDATSKKTRGYE